MTNLILVYCIYVSVCVFANPIFIGNSKQLRAQTAWQHFGLASQAAFNLLHLFKCKSDSVPGHAQAIPPDARSSVRV